MIWMLALSLVTLLVSPTSLMEGGTVRVMCRVTPHADNRSVEAGIGEYMRSARQLDGAASPRTHEFWFSKVPCGSEVAFCIVYQTQGRYEVRQQKLAVMNCGDQP